MATSMRSQVDSYRSRRSVSNAGLHVSKRSLGRVRLGVCMCVKTHDGSSQLVDPCQDEWVQMIRKGSPETTAVNERIIVSEKSSSG